MHWSDPLDSWLQGRTGKGETASLGTSMGSKSSGIDLWKGGDDSRQLGSVEVDLAEEKFVWMIIQPADDVSGQGAAFHGREILALAALAAAIHGRHAEILGEEGEVGGPVAVVPGIAVEVEYGGMTSLGFGAKIFGVDAAVPHAGEGEVETFKAGAANGMVGPYIWFRWGGIEFLQGTVPVGVEILGPGVGSFVLPKFLQGFV